MGFRNAGYFLRCLYECPFYLFIFKMKVQIASLSFNLIELLIFSSDSIYAVTSPVLNHQNPFLDCLTQIKNVINE